MADPDFQLYTKHEYFSEFAAWVRQAKPDSRILLMSMDFDPDEPEIAAILDALEFAAQKGARIHLGTDARCFMTSNGKTGSTPLSKYLPGPLWSNIVLPPSDELSEPYKLKQKRLERLRKYPNVTVTVTNTPDHAHSLTIAGRSHIKTGIVDDRLILGGCNLDTPDYIDLMVGWRDAAVADKLYGLLSAALEDGNIKRALRAIDQTIPVSSDSRILIDAGVRGQSLIFDEALVLIDAAEEWLMLTCQFFPNGITAQHLLRARDRGVKVKILYANLASHGLIGGSIQLLSQSIERLRVPGALFKDGLPRDSPKIHAKVIACDAGVMIGSHNYVNAGVRLGTAEIALQSTDVQLAQATRQAIHEQLPAALQS